MTSPNRRRVLASALAVLGLASSYGCDRAPSSAPVAAAASSAEPPRPAPAPSPSDTSFRLPGAKRVVAIGDVHGDLDATRAALRLAGAIDARDRWIGKDLVVVQTGDQLDRGDDERRILDLFEKLTLEAQKSGARFLPLNGNHEVMNVAADFRYVTEGGFREFGEFAVGTPAAPQVPEPARGRFAAFAPGGVYARLLAQRPTVAIVGDTVFAHGGVLPQHIDYGLGRLNAEVSAWMRGERAELPLPMQGEDGPIWTRLYGQHTLDASACATLTRVLDKLQVKRMVVGHTVQKSGINSACDGRVFRIDIGLSKYYGKKPAQVLEIQGGAAKVLEQDSADAAQAGVRSLSRKAVSVP